MYGTMLEIIAFENQRESGRQYHLTTRDIKGLQ